MLTSAVIAAVRPVFSAKVTTVAVHHPCSAQCTMSFPVIISKGPYALCVTMVSHTAAVPPAARQSFAGASLCDVVNSVLGCAAEPTVLLLKQNIEPS